MFELLFIQDYKVENLFCGAPFGSEPSLFFSNYLFGLALVTRSHPIYFVEKSTAKKDITIDITSDSQVNSNYPYRWSSLFKMTFSMALLK